ncbi:MAG TPA: glycosyltransferase family A protein [Longimicrobiales bacterium]
MQQPLVSVIVANHNYGRFLPHCIDSVLAQTYDPIELVVVDDGSTDDSRAVLASYGSKVRAIFQQNAGQAAALSAGFASSRGEIICLLDADDGWYPHKVATVVAALQANRAVLWLRHKLAMVNEQLEPLKGVMPTFRGSGMVPGDPVLLLEGGVTAGTSLVMRRTLAERIFPVVITPQLALDADDTVILAKIFAQRATGYSLDAVLGYYRKHAGARFSANDLPRLLRREEALATALGNVLGYGRPSSSYKLATVLGAMEGAPWWAPQRLGNYLGGLRRAARLWTRPRLLARQTLALTYAFAAPRSWLHKMQTRSVAPHRSDELG